MLYNVRSAESCSDALDTIIGSGTQLASIDMAFRYGHRSSDPKRAASGEWSSRLTFDYQVDCPSTRIEIVRLTWEAMSKREEGFVRRMESDLLVHERGHIAVAKRVLAQNDGPVTVRAPSKEELLAKLENLAAERRASTEQALIAEALTGGAYDRATDHGRAQSQGPRHGYPGGNDVRLHCAAP